MAANANLHKAKNEKNDEFYTQLTDVAAELKHYKDHFRGKTVFCNCDDPTWSAFWKYFHLNFGKLGLKKLVSTHYDRTEPTYKMEYEGGDDDNIEAGTVTPLEGNGDFRNQECLDLLDECDIVVTNPPFSLFREYVRTLMEHGKKFIIIGNMNCVTYKEIFPLIKNDELWLGTNSKAGTRKGNTMCFGVPEGTEIKNISLGSHGERLTQVSAWWFTNLDHPKRHEKLALWKSYNAEDYPKYDNYDAINVDKTTEIPMDYFECIGVPISFLDKYCADQFEIIGATESEGKGFSNGLFLSAATADSGQRTADSYAAVGQRETCLQADIHSSQTLKIVLQPDGSGRIYRQNDVDLRRLAEQYANDGFMYYSGVMGVPISFLDKYCPEQFEIVAFRKGDDGKDLVFTRERESSTVLSSPCSTAEWGLITGAKQTICSDGKSRYARVAIRRRT